MIIDLARMPDSIAFFPHGRRVYAVMTIEHYESLTARAVDGDRAVAAAAAVGCPGCGTGTEFHSVSCPSLDPPAAHAPATASAVEVPDGI